MALPTAQKFAWSLAQTLMTCLVLFTPTPATEYSRR